MRNFYNMLSVPADASADDIKKAFRREIARYHPDKVQHLGQEFQEMASGIAADLTEAYRVLMDAGLRAKYDEDVLGAPAPARAQTASPPPPTHQGPAAPPPPAADASPSASPGQSAPGAASMAGVEFVRKASLSRLKDAVEDVLGSPEVGHVAGFDLAVLSKPKRGLFRKADDQVRLLVKFVPVVDAAAIAAVWANAMKGKVADAVLCVLLVGPGMAPSRDLSTAISEQRRKARNAGPVLVPVDVRDWDALFPPDTPAAVRTLIQRLKDEKR